MELQNDKNIILRSVKTNPLTICYLNKIYTNINNFKIEVKNNKHVLSYLFNSIVIPLNLHLQDKASVYRIMKKFVKDYSINDFDLWYDMI